MRKNENERKWMKINENRCGCHEVRHKKRENKKMVYFTIGPCVKSTKVGLFRVGLAL